MPNGPPRRDMGPRIIEKPISRSALPSEAAGGAGGAVRKSVSH